jgi:hypothetical protein
MRHAGPAVLDRLADLPASLRRRAGLFADLRPDTAWARLPVNDTVERDRLLQAVEVARAS